MRASVVLAPLLLLALAFAPACGGDADTLPEGLVCESQHAWPIHIDRRLDLLFVVDRSPSMGDEQALISDLARDVADEFERFEGGLPDIHVAVTSSDLGGDAVPGCSRYGDDGALLGAERCGARDGFLRVRGLADGSADQNFDGDFETALACVLDLEPSTCAVNQPLAAAVRSLDGAAPANLAWRRPGAPLLVLVITDSDDCSLVDPGALAGITATDPDDLEAAVDHACFARGAVCSPAEPTQPGLHTGCEPRGDRGVGLTADLLAQLRRASGGGLPAVGVVAGPADAVVLDGPRLASSCNGERTAGPAPRLTALAGDLGVATDVCGADWAAGLGLFDAALLVPLNLRCVEPAIDLDPATAGFQTECAGELLRRNADGSDSSAGGLPWCAPGMAPGQPCLELVETPYCTESGAELRFHRGDLDTVDLLASLRCRVACE